MVGETYGRQTGLYTSEQYVSYDHWNGLVLSYVEVFSDLFLIFSRTRDIVLSKTVLFVTIYTRGEIFDS